VTRVAPAATLGELLAGIGGAQWSSCEPADPCGPLASDSRHVGPGGVFVALRGATSDGHDFIARARERGAAVIIAERVPPDDRGGAIRVPNTTAALPHLAANAHGWPGRALALAGVTGTNGKTTTAHLVGAMLARAGRPHLRIGTTGNFLVDHEEPATHTTPFPLELQAILARGVELGATAAVMEVSSHALAQDRVAPLTFQAVGFTSFSQDHLDFHPDMQTYLAAKLRLAEVYLAADGVAVAAEEASTAGEAFLDAARRRGARACRVARTAEHGAELWASHVLTDAGGTRFVLHTPAGEREVTSPLVGGFNLDNILVASGLALGLGLSLDVIAQALARAGGAPGRLERVGDLGGPAVFVDYAHTPDAVARVLATLRPLTRGRLVILLGCGGDRDRTKRPHMGRIAATGADVFVATSDNPRTEDPEAIVDELLAGVPRELARRSIRLVDRAQAIRETIAGAAPEDTVLLAGKGHETYQVLAGGAIHFDDREHARAALAARRSGSRIPGPGD
jgi:UDP-N-acetylmuramoyl-L-alanyl-D-glutamate--2,6-diaminopimelate ligase